MLLRVTVLAAAAAASAPPFVTATALRPAARGLQDFAECPVLTKIKKDDGRIAASALRMFLHRFPGRRRSPFLRLATRTTIL